MNKKIAFIYDDIFLKHDTPEDHPESKDRLIAIVNRLKKEELWNKLLHINQKSNRRRISFGS
jgi:Deacetylases, including yeast histone deacetylase and acetoin utilization protein